MKYAIRSNSTAHGFKKNEVVSIVSQVSDILFIAINDAGKYWAVEKKDLIPYKPHKK